MFHLIGRVVSRSWPVILLAWAAVLGAALWSAPPWQDVVLDREFAYMPADTPSRQGEAAFERAFPRQYNPSTLALVVHREDRPLTRQDMDFIEQKLKPGLLAIADEEGGLASGAEEKSRGDRSIIASIHTPKDPRIGPLLVSVDKKAALVVVEMTTELLEHRNWSTMQMIDDLLERLKSEGHMPAGLAIAESGNAAIGRDISLGEAHSAAVTEYWTLLFVVVLLLLIYRAPFLTLVPLTTMFVAVQIALHLLALSAKFGLTTLFEGMQTYIIIVMYGTGVDYCLFLVSRCKEELDSGADVRQAVGAAIGKVGVALTASAATVAIGIGMMIFARFGEYHHAGVAIFFSLLVGWGAALTLTPSLLRLLGKWAFWPSRAAGPQTRPSLWDRLAGALQRRPGTILLGAMIMMVPFAIVAGLHGNDLDYDLLKRLPADAPSNTGTMIFRDHFPEGMTSPIVVLLDKPGFDFQSDQGQDAIQTLTQGLMARREELGLADVRSLWRPLGTSQAAQDVTDQEAADTAIDPEQEAVKFYVNHGDATQLQLVLKDNPLSRENLDRMDKLESVLRAELPAPIKDANYHVLGFTSSFHDLRAVTRADQTRIELLVVASVFLILMALLRQIAVALCLIVSVLLSYFCTLGVAFTLFGALDPTGFNGLDWKVPIFLFVILMAIGADYNIFLLTRVGEEQENLEPIPAVASALVKTGRIITSCGIIMAGTFASLLTSSLVDLFQLGFALSFGILLDTYVVRPILVPAFLILLKSGAVRSPRARSVHKYAQGAPELVKENVTR